MAMIKRCRPRLAMTTIERPAFLWTGNHGRREALGDCSQMVRQGGYRRFVAKTGHQDTVAEISRPWASGETG